MTPLPAGRLPPRRLIRQGTGPMGEVKVELQIENTVDRERAILGDITPERIRSATVRELVDSGSVMLILPRDVVEALGLREVGKRVVVYVDERRDELPVAGYVTVRVGDRATSQECLV